MINVEAAKFIGAYERLCRDHNMMVIQLEEDDGYYRFAIGELSDKTRHILDQSLEEMRIGEVITLRPESR